MIEQLNIIILIELREDNIMVEGYQCINYFSAKSTRVNILDISNGIALNHNEAFDDGGGISLEKAS